jgi:hypothetical protein
VLAASCLLLGAAFAQEGGDQPAPAQQAASAPGALLRGLDKVSGQTVDMELRVGDTFRLGRLTVALMDCRYPASDPSSNAYAQIVILDEGAGVDAPPVFQGWMVAASPALSALDHPRYDVWALRCLIPATTTEGDGG